MQTSTSPSIPSYTERLTYRHGGQFGRWWKPWIGSKHGGGMNARKYLGDLDALFAATRPASREEWERVWVRSMGRKLINHARRFRRAAGEGLSMEEALTLIVIHAVDETWDGQQVKRQACAWLNEEFREPLPEREVQEAVEALVAAAEDHRGLTLAPIEVAEIQQSEQAAYAVRNGAYRLAEPWMVALWAVSVVEIRDGQVVTGFWVKPRSFFAQASSTNPKSWERAKVRAFIKYWEGKQAAAPEVTFLTYDFDRSRCWASNWKFIAARVALAEVEDRSPQKDMKVVNRVRNGDIKGGQHLRAVEPEELREREQQAHHAEQHVVAPTAQVEPEHPTLF